MKHFYVGLFAVVLLFNTALAATVNSNEAALKTARDVVKTHHLTTLVPNCVTYSIDKKDQKYWYIETREKHDASCGGDTEISPRLFTLRIAKKNGAVQSDLMLERYDYDGAFHPLP